MTKHITTKTLFAFFDTIIIFLYDNKVIVYILWVFEKIIKKG